MNLLENDPERKITVVLATPQTYLKKARQTGYSIAGFSAYNMETVQAVVEVAEDLRAPVFIQTTSATIMSAGIDYISGLVKIAAETTEVPVFLHLDHGKNYEQVIQCLRHGYTSVMIDGSSLPFNENSLLVKDVVRSAHSVGVAVEAELGHVGAVNDNLSIKEREQTYTDPAMAYSFVSDTHLDSLAIAIGTAHGAYKGEPKLDLARLNQIAELVPHALVLHGASGVPDATMRTAIEAGISKFNIATELKTPLANALKDYFQDNPDGSDPRTYFPIGKEAYKSVVRDRIQLSGSAGTV